MVDVGYFINGKHGVIKKVMPMANTKTDHLCFMQADGEEQYALKKEDIEYVIPSDIECVGYTEEQMIELCQKVDPPMTNAEKFKEVFGFEVNRNVVEDVCSVVQCDNISDCNRCPYQSRFEWDDPYVKAEVKD